MSSRFPDAAVVALVALVALCMMAFGCEREERRFHPVTSAPGSYDGTAWGVNEGKRLYGWYGCVGCHAHGGGATGPALMDATWIYGSEPSMIYASIAEGRPNGMPSFKGRVAENEIWELVAYVRSMSGQLRLDVEPGRNDSLSAKPPEAMQSKLSPEPGRPAP